MNSVGPVLRYVCTACRKANDTREAPADSVLECWNCRQRTIHVFKEYRNNLRTRRKGDSSQR